MNPEETTPPPAVTPDGIVPVPTGDTQPQTPDLGDDNAQQPAEPATPAPAASDPTPPPAPTPTTTGADLFDQIAEKIIEQQEAIIGPVAVEQAKQIKEIKVNWPQHDVDIDGNPQAAIDQLVEQYKELFGQIAVQVSKEAVASILAQLPADQQPKSLQ